MPNTSNYSYNYYLDVSDVSNDSDFVIDERTAKLAIAGGVLGTIASIVSTYTAYLALQDIEKNRQKQLKANARIADLEAQVRYLMQQSQNKT